MSVFFHRHNRQKSSWYTVCLMNIIMVTLDLKLARKYFFSTKVIQDCSETFSVKLFRLWAKILLSFQCLHCLNNVWIKLLSFICWFICISHVYSCLSDDNARLMLPYFSFKAKNTFLTNNKQINKIYSSTTAQTNAYRLHQWPVSVTDYQLPTLLFMFLVTWLL